MENNLNTNKALNEDANLCTDKMVKQAHQEWLSALDILEDPIFIHDKDFRILRCNRSYQQKAGIPYAQIIGRKYFDVFPKSDTQTQNFFDETDDTASNTTDKEVVVGDTIFHSRTYSIIDENNDYLYSVRTLEDITERLQIQRAMQTSEQQYRRLFEAAKEGILILDAQTGVIVDANPFILHLLAYSYTEMVGMKLWEIGPFADIVESKVSFKKLQSKKYIRYEDLPLKTKEGRQINVEFISNLYDVEDKKVIQCNIRDIADRLQIQRALQTSERQYRRLFEAAKDGILILDAQTGVIVDANPFILHLLSYSYTEMVGMKLWEIGLFADIVESKVSFKELQSKKYIRYEDLPLKTKEGRQVNVEFVSNLYDVEDKKVIQCNIRDITERKKMEKELWEKDKIMMIQSRQAAMGDMIAMIAHQWRQPLSIMSMEVNNLKLSIELEEEITTELLENHVECISDQVQQLSQTIDDFRNFFKPEQVKESVILNDVIEKTMRIIRKSMEDNNITVTIENNSETKLETCPNQLLQVFLNIINNAKDILKIKSIPDAQVLITINDIEDSVVTSICDNGGGIAENAINRIGEPYFTTKQTEGTGLGIYMSKTIITEHLGGKFTWVNRDGGACFSVSLPKAQTFDDTDNAKIM